MYKILLLIVSLLTLSFRVKAQKNSAPLPVILDTDMGPDYDDTGAITLLHAFADKGEATILATIASTKYEGVAAVLNVFNTYFNKQDIPIGVPRGNALTLKDSQHWTDTLIAKYPHTINNNNEVADAVAVYRKTLAAQPDSSVAIITVGFLTNLASLLKSLPDTYSPLSGKELVKKKVKKLVSMAGKFPAGKEFNIEEDAASAKYVFENWPTPVIFSGFEIGSKIKTGIPLIQNKQIKNSPVKDVYSICIPKAKEDSAGRMSWDQTAVLVAIKGANPYYKVRKGTIEIAADGSNSWKENKDGNQYYLLENLPEKDVERIINNLMMHQPE
ncbi:nucleoside hydrolase [Rubrolithibacter danxiaensis]|uniref:nucleoside hydrolase n=1 Tax=Rubrolithibacter danxiaensis TaxID=3390805 RepID=UPI003BF9130B